ncbi:putative presilphiperfolan-8-beta-ol synthase [Rosellinia necatrix]|uniref:Terpene synthase n=1 Tax=Rosellinia necatrix TaxID=77044 RepID=A0A1S7UP06_ROSNE|nr:putative presilphiperfolan-8-beta-ol synthase [Rosellinia necatrix]
MADYVAGALMHVEDMSARQIPSPEQMLEKRRFSAGVGPLFALVEYAHALRIPDYVFEHPVIQEIEHLAIDFVAIMNDILSYVKEERDSVPNNVVAAARMSGLGPQEAFDYIGTLLDSRYARWEKAVQSVPNWGAGINSHVDKYVQGVSNVVRANLYWGYDHRLLGIVYTMMGTC